MFSFVFWENPWPEKKRFEIIGPLDTWKKSRWQTRKKIQVCSTWNFSKVWIRRWFLKTLIFRNQGADEKVVTEVLEKHKVKNCVNSFWCFLWLAWAFSHSNLSPKMHSATMQAVSRRRSTSKAPWSCPLWAKEIVLCSKKPLSNICSKSVQNLSKIVKQICHQKCILQQCRQSAIKVLLVKHLEASHYELKK